MTTQPTPAADEQPTWLKNFIPAPSDPALLTIEDVRSAFTGDWSALKDVVKVAKEVHAAKTVSPVE